MTSGGRVDAPLRSAPSAGRKARTVEVTMAPSTGAASRRQRSRAGAAAATREWSALEVEGAGPKAFGVGRFIGQSRHVDLDLGRLAGADVGDRVDGVLQPHLLAVGGAEGLALGLGIFAGRNGDVALVMLIGDRRL